MSIVVVGKGGTLGTLLAERLAADLVEVRAPDPRADSVIPSIETASVVINAGGPRVRKGLAWADYFREHVGVTSRVLRSMRPGTHLVHLSSTAVFGARGKVLAVDDPPAPTLFPSAAYASAKLAAEHAAFALGQERGIAVSVLRPSMIYGLNVDSALESIRKLARRGVSLRLTPARIRQHLTHVDLFVDVVRRASEQRPEGNRRQLIVADPFVLENRDLVPLRGVPVTLSLHASALLRPFKIHGIEPILDTLDVLAIDNEFAWRPAFEELGIDPARHSRERTFEPYWSVQ